MSTVVENGRTEITNKRRMSPGSGRSLPDPARCACWPGQPSQAWHGEPQCSRRMRDHSILELPMIVAASDTEEPGGDRTGPVPQLVVPPATGPVHLIDRARHHPTGASWLCRLNGYSFRATNRT